MNDMTTNEKLVKLAKAQECMLDIVVVLENWDRSQAALESITYETMNSFDKTINIVKNGRNVLSDLISNCTNGSETPDETRMQYIAELARVTGQLYQNILDSAQATNEYIHKLEEKVVCQRETGNYMKNSVNVIEDSVSQTIACGEFLLAEI